MDSFLNELTWHTRSNVLGEIRKKEQDGLGWLDRLLNDCFN